MRRSTVLIVSTGALLLAGAAAAWWWTRPVTAPAVVVHSAPLLRTLQFSARVTSSSRVEVGSTVTGRVIEVAVQEGQRVAAGALLLRLEGEELRAALAQALAGERQAEARLAGLRGSGRRSAEAGVAQAESNLAAARAEGRRTEELVAQAFVSASRLDEARRAVAVAQAQLDNARAQRAATADSGSEVAQAAAQLALARAATQAARARLAQAEIRAPAAARVLTRAVEPGQIVQPGRALLALALEAPLQLEAQVDERYLAQLAPGQVAGVVADAYPERPFAARVQSIAPLVDAQRGAIAVKLAPQAPMPEFLREDMTLSVEVETGRLDAALTVPVAALRGSEGVDAAPHVLVARDGRVERRSVRLGLRTLEGAAVLEGLAEGEAVLLGPALAPGSRVRLSEVAVQDKLQTQAGAAPRDSAEAAVGSSWGR